MGNEVNKGHKPVPRRHRKRKKRYSKINRNLARFFKWAKINPVKFVALICGFALIIVSVLFIIEIIKELKEK